MKHVNITIKGKVQGVFFRASAKEQAERLGVSGYVCNRFDGDVYAEVEGKGDLVDSFVNWCHRGPVNASVHHVSVEDGLIKDFKKFEIQRDR